MCVSVYIRVAYVFEYDNEAGGRERSFHDGRGGGEIEVGNITKGRGRRRRRRLLSSGNNLGVDLWDDGGGGGGGGWEGNGFGLFRKFGNTR